MTHLVDAFHLADHQFGIADHLERSDLIFGGIAESGEESLIFGVVVGVVAKVFAEFGDWMSGRVVDSNTIASRPRIAAGSPIDVGGVGGGRGFRCGEKIAGIGRTRRHGMSLQRGRASSENHRYPMDEGASRVSENVLLPLSGSWNRDGAPNVLEGMTTSPPL